MDGCRQLIDSGIASGGMRAKLEAATDAIRSGLAEVVIAPGARSGIIPQFLAGEQIGTRVSA
jgi:acetylglutamate kinase